MIQMNKQEAIDFAESRKWEQLNNLECNCKIKEFLS